MVKNGKAFLFQIMLLCLSSFLYADQAKRITLQLLDANGESLDKIGKNIPCIVRLTMQNISHAKEPNFIPGFQHAKVQKGNTSKSHKISLNGSEHITSVEYIVVVDREQEITFGPYSCDGVTSNSITCKVVGTSGHVHKDKKADLVIMKVHVPQKKYVVGQKVLVHIVLLQQKNEQFTDIGHDQLSCAGCKIGKSFVINSAGITEKINDVEYIKQEYIVEVYPQSAGNFSIPPLQGYYIQNYQAAAYSFWLPQPQQKVFHANAVEFKVDALPPMPAGKKVDYVGVLDGIILKVPTESSQVGKAITATLWMQGDGNIETINFPELQLPEQVKVYSGNSKTSYVTNTMNAQRTFEYVLQFTQPGEFEFPIQKFTYFDVQKGKYKTVEFGGNISIVIEPGLQNTELEKVSEQKNIENSSEDELPLLLVESNSMNYSQIPHALMIFLYWIAVIMALVHLLYRYCVSRRFEQKVYSVLQSWIFLFHIQKNTVESIRSAWQKYIESMSTFLNIHVPTNDIYALELVKALGLQEKEIEAWKRFYSLVLQATYDKSGKDFQLVQLQNESKLWIHRFKRLIWHKV